MTEHSLKTRYNNHKLSFTRKKHSHRPIKIHLGPKRTMALITRLNGPLTNEQLRTGEALHAAIWAESIRETLYTNR